MRSTTLLATLVLTLSTMSGCYLGRTKSAKTSAYVLNGLIAGVGGVIAVSASSNNAEHGDDISAGIGAALASGAQVSLGGAIVIGAVIVTVITLAVPTEPEPASDPQPRAVAIGTVTAPGLTPAVVQIR